jgi:hypothetical protein
MIVQIFEQTEEYIDIGCQFRCEEIQMMNWLTENFGPRSMYNGWELICTMYYHGFRLLKHKKENLVLFQLTWPCK